MTSTVTVEAHGWDIEVTAVDTNPTTKEVTESVLIVVRKNTKVPVTFWDTRSLKMREIPNQPAVLELPDEWKVD